jgi:putative tryptophan/tyrosine transport system substrate-binding protein
MNRRTFVWNGAAAGALLPRVLGAQPSARVYRLGYIGLTGPAGSSGRPADPQWDAFHDELGTLGYVEGQNLVVERRWIEGREERIPALVAELLGKNVDVLVTTHTGTARAAKQATRTVPIVMAGVSNPERTGLVESLARPGGNVTGVSNMFAESSGKIVELFKEACPNRSRLGVVLGGDLGNPATRDTREALESAAKVLRVTLAFELVASPDALDAALKGLLRQRVEALHATQGLLAHRVKVGDFAMANRLPLFTRSDNWPWMLLSFSVSWPDLFRLVARQIVQILKGVRPADLPVQQATKFELAINMKTAKALGLTIPQSILLRADQVID